LQEVLLFAEAVLKAEILYKAEVLSKAEFASRSECSPAAQYKMAEKPEALCMPDALPSDEVSMAQVSPSFEDLLQVEPSKSEVSSGSNESSTLEDSSMSEAFPGPEELPNVEFSVPGVESRNRYFSEEYLSQEMAGPQLEGENYVQDENYGQDENYVQDENYSQDENCVQDKNYIQDESYVHDEEPPMAPLQILSGLQDPFAELEAKLARLSSTVTRVDSPQTDIAQVPEQVANVTCDAMHN
jgi:kinesin family protein 3/17